MRIDDLNEYMNFEIVGHKKKGKMEMFFFKQFLSEIIFVAYIKKTVAFFLLNLGCWKKQNSIEI